MFLPFFVYSHILHLWTKVLEKLRPFTRLDRVTSQFLSGADIYIDILDVLDLRDTSIGTDRLNLH